MGEERVALFLFDHVHRSSTDDGFVLVFDKDPDVRALVLGRDGEWHVQDGHKFEVPLMPSGETSTPPAASDKLKEGLAPGAVLVRVQNTQWGLGGYYVM